MTKPKPGPRMLTLIRAAFLLIIVLILASASALEGGAQTVAQWVAIASITVLAVLPIAVLTGRALRACSALTRRLQARRDRRDG